jgi:hypothetical protein
MIGNEKKLLKSFETNVRRVWQECWVPSAETTTTTSHWWRSDFILIDAQINGIIDDLAKSWRGNTAIETNENYDDDYTAARFLVLEMIDEES